MDKRYFALNQVEKYYAHTLEDEKGSIIRRELLTEHSDRTIKYFHLLLKQKGFSKQMGRFIENLFGKLSEEGEQFLWEMIDGIPLFHDFGKINPDYQKQVMKNQYVAENNMFWHIGKRHSLISAVIYIDYYIEELKKTVKDKEDKAKLRPFIIYHAYVIERHHSNLNDFQEFLLSLKEGAGKDVIDIFAEGRCSAYRKEFRLTNRLVLNMLQTITHVDWNREKGITLYAYIRLLYSFLVASDYYATTEFKTQKEMKQFGNLNEIEKWIAVYEDTEVMKSVRAYQKEQYPKPLHEIKKEHINDLRTEILTDAEHTLKENKNGSLFYLEAPTGSGKSNIAMALSFQLIKGHDNLQKILYIYPFNTLVEQNRENLEKVFGNNREISEQIAVVNSLTPIKMPQKTKEMENEEVFCYQKALLDRQFLNYPMVISTHVSLFDIMFGERRESAFGFHQLMNSVVVLDEIQSYKNELWGKIICFLQEFSYLLNMKLIIMSATLPNLDLLSGNSSQTVQLMNNRDNYFSHVCFKGRVKISYELLESENIEDELIEHILNQAASKKKILIEFIKKKSAAEFFEKLKVKKGVPCDVEYMSGEDSIWERSRILQNVKESTEGIILVATQVVEAGVDIDMDIGYKNISKLDSEEQFMGRINRSCLRKGEVYFFKLDDPQNVYRDQDVRLDKEFTVENRDMREILVSKNFSKYYEKVLAVLKRTVDELSGEKGLDEFFGNIVGKLNWPKVASAMRLIEESSWSMTVYLARKLQDGQGDEVDGKKLWKEYVELLENFSMDYAEKRVKLSQITSKMNCFLYQIKQNSNFNYNDKVGEIFYIEDGEKYFRDGKLDRNKIQGEVGDFVDFI